MKPMRPATASFVALMFGVGVVVTAIGIGFAIPAAIAAVQDWLLWHPRTLFVLPMALLLVALAKSIGAPLHDMLTRKPQ